MPIKAIREASWVWAPGSGNGLNRYAAFRLRLPDALDRRVRRVPVAVSAATHYILWVNGRPIGRGPCREWLGAIGVDAYDIAPFLLPATNVIAALCHNAGEDTNAFQRTPPGFFFAGGLGRHGLSTGQAAWEAMTLEAWRPASSRMHTEYKRFNEELDLRRYHPAVWELGEGKGWSRAVAAEAVRASRPIMVRREIPPLRERVVPGAMRLVAAAAFSPYADRAVTPAVAMLRAVRRRVQGRRMEAGRAGLPLVVQPGPPLSLILDVGGMTSGVLAFEIAAAGGEQLAIGYGDRLIKRRRSGFETAAASGMNPLENPALLVNATHGDGEAGRNNSVDRFRLAPGRNRWQGAFNTRGFRYVQLDLAGLRQPLAIHGLHVHEIGYPTEPRGHFACDDPELNRLWAAGRRTLDLCMDDTFFDNPSRERQQYGGDALIQSQCAYYYFGDPRLPARFLRVHAGGMRADGAMESGGPWPFRQVIPAWTLLWVEAIRNHVDFTGDATVGRRLAPAVRRAMRGFEAFIATDGLLDIPERLHGEGAQAGVLWNFIDWQPGGRSLRGEPARLALNAIYYGALRTAAELLAARYGARAGDDLLRRRKAVGTALRERLRQQSPDGYEHALAYAALVGLTDAGMAAIADRARHGALASDIMFLYFTLASLEQAGHGDAVVAAMRHGFAAMLKDGGDTLGETYDAPGSLNRALCQGIGAVPGYFLPRVVGGIRLRPLRERTVMIDPWCGDLAWCEAVVPTPEGSIAAFWRNNGGMEMTLILPNKHWKARLTAGGRQKVKALRIRYNPEVGSRNSGRGLDGTDL